MRTCDELLNTVPVSVCIHGDVHAYKQIWCAWKRDVWMSNFISWGGSFMCISAPKRAWNRWNCACMCDGEKAYASVCVCVHMCECVVCIFAHSLGGYPTIAISGSPDSASIMTPLVTNPYWCTQTQTHIPHIQNPRWTLPLISMCMYSTCDLKKKVKKEKWHRHASHACPPRKSAT